MRFKKCSKSKGSGLWQIQKQKFFSNDSEIILFAFSVQIAFGVASHDGPTVESAIVEVSIRIGLSFVRFDQSVETDAFETVVVTNDRLLFDDQNVTASRVIGRPFEIDMNGRMLAAFRLDFARDGEFLFVERGQETDFG